MIIVECVLDRNATSFGYSGTYWDYVLEIAQKQGSLHGLINLNVSKDEIEEILRESGFVGYRFDGALKWILKTIEMLRKLKDG